MLDTLQNDPNDGDGCSCKQYYEEINDECKLKAVCKDEDAENFDSNVPDDAPQDDSLCTFKFDDENIIPPIVSVLNSGEVSVNIKSSKDGRSVRAKKARRKQAVKELFNRITKSSPTQIK